MHQTLIFGLGAYHSLAQAIAATNRSFVLGQLEEKQFPDGERYHRLPDVRGSHVVLVAGTLDDRHTLDLFDIACAAAKYGASSLHLVVPYFGYSTMERAVKSGEIVKAKTRARLFSSIPQASQGNSIYLLDLHADGIPHYMEGNLIGRHVYAEPVILKAIRDCGGEDFVVASTDSGRSKWVESFALHLGVSPAFCLKKRHDDGSLSLSAVSAQVEGKNVVIYDDMIRTGGSLLQAAQAYRQAGARSVSAVATHGVFPGESLNHLVADGGLERICITNSIPQHQFHSNFFVYDVAPVLSGAVLQNIKAQ